jgi:hypothetical protein
VGLPAERPRHEAHDNLRVQPGSIVRVEMAGSKLWLAISTKATTPEFGLPKGATS